MDKAHIMASSVPLKVITVATHDCPGLRNYKHTMEKWGYDVTILGHGRKWQGFAKTKIPLVLQELERLRGVGFDGLVMFTDSSDLMATAGPQAVVDAFSVYKGDLVVGANWAPKSMGELKFYLPLDKWHKAEAEGRTGGINQAAVDKGRFPKGLRPLEHARPLCINSGVMIGTVPAMMNLYAWQQDNMQRFGDTSDQKMVDRYAERFPERVQIDKYSIIVHNVDFSKLLRPGCKGYRGKNNGPHALVHFPGMRNYWPLALAYNRKAKQLCGVKACTYKAPSSSPFLLGTISMLMFLGIVIVIVGVVVCIRCKHPMSASRG